MSSSPQQPELSEQPELIEQPREEQPEVSEPGSKRFGFSEEDLNNSQSLFFGLLPGDMTEEELRNDFLGAFNISSVKMGVPKKGPENTKYAFVDFASREEAKEAYEKYCGSTWREQNIKVDWDIGPSKKQELNKRSGYGQRSRSGYRGGSRSRYSGSRGGSYGSSRPSGRRGNTYPYKNNRFSPYGRERSYRESDDQRYDSYSSGSRNYDYNKYSQPSADYPSHSSNRYDYHHRDEVRHPDRNPVHDYSRYGAPEYSHQPSSYRHSSPPRGYRDPNYREQGYREQSYRDQGGYREPNYRDQNYREPVYHSRDYAQDSGRVYPPQEYSRD